MAGAILGMRKEQGQRASGKFPRKKQVEVYRGEGQNLEPPIPFQGYLAPNWKSVLPIVNQRLALESDGRLAALMPILVVISEHYCSLTERDDVLAEVSNAIPRMGEFYRTTAEEDLRKIAHPAKELPACR